MASPAFAASPSTAAPTPKLAGDDIKQAWFDGKPFTATAPDGSAFTMTYKPDGKASKVAIAPTKAAPVHGFWRVIAEGYCTRWSGSPREKCYSVEKTDAGVTVHFGKQMVATWSR